MVLEASTFRHTSTTSHSQPSREESGPDLPPPATSRKTDRRLPPPQLQILTQNVQGLLKNREHLENWFDAFRRRHDHRHFDIEILQETRATERWAPVLEDMYARAWGYDSKKLTDPLSYWPATETAAGGVAILLHPQTAISNVRPWRQDLWSSHFAAVSGTLDGEDITLVCMYGSTNAVQREQQFLSLAEQTKPEGIVLLGGDFNCTLDPELDRSRRASPQQLSDGLAQLLLAWDLMDAATDSMLAITSMSEVREFHAAHHTYWYTLRDGTIATARLDRWYLSTGVFQRLRRLVTTAPFCRTDHDGVIVQLLATDHQLVRRRRQQPRLRYPLPDCARDAIHEVGETLLAEAGTTLADQPAEDSARGWDHAKSHNRRTSLKVQRDQLTLATRRYRKQMKRLHDALRDAKRDAHARLHPIGPNIDAISAALSKLTLAPTARLRSLRRELVRLQCDRLLRTRRARNASHAGRTHESVRAFFRRISVKLSRRHVSVLPRQPHSRLTTADRVGQDWIPIIQQTPCEEKAQDLVFERLAPKLVELPDDLDDMLFTAEAVAKAIKSCPRGKACGPDGIPNDWYREHIDTAAPVLATLFTKWYKACVLPPSFKAASVCCIPKKSQPLTGLDFRPIALLNTGYKIYARILFDRIRIHVPKMVSATQYGFVKGRQVHDAIDVWSALQVKAASKEISQESLGVFLDFAKAYDSLDRRFLTRALQRHGLPQAMIAAIDHMHLGTTAAFIVDGQVSATLDVTTGIRQGCPLAPTLFVLAVDVLYDLVQTYPSLPGLSISEEISVAIVGFADDTSVYLRTPSELQLLQGVLDLFGAASGLKVNADKSTAVFLASEGWTERIDTHGFLVADRSQLVRYLGGQISTEPVGHQVWDLTLQQLRTRLHLAAIKTTDLLQRIQVCQAVVLPKILFVARHSWPTADMIDQIQAFVHTYAWHGLLTPSDRVGRAWGGSSIAFTERKHGGLQIPSIRDKLLLLSATTVQR